MLVPWQPSSEALSRVYSSRLRMESKERGRKKKILKVSNVTHTIKHRKDLFSPMSKVKKVYLLFFF